MRGGFCFLWHLFYCNLAQVYLHPYNVQVKVFVLYGRHTSFVQDIHRVSINVGLCNRLCLNLFCCFVSKETWRLVLPRICCFFFHQFILCRIYVVNYKLLLNWSHGNKSHRSTPSKSASCWTIPPPAYVPIFPSRHLAILFSLMLLVIIAWNPSIGINSLDWVTETRGLWRSMQH
jgi:hypothetical protein